MKRISIILIFLIISTTAFTNSSDTLVTDTDTEKLIDKYSDKLESDITTLTKKLEKPAKFVYITFVKKQKIYGVVGAISVILLLVFVIGSGYGFFVSALYEIKNDMEMKFKTGIWGILFLFGAIIFFVVLSTQMSPILQGLLNPHYGAIKEIQSILQ